MGYSGHVNNKKELIKRGRNKATDADETLKENGKRGSGRVRESRNALEPQSPGEGKREREDREQR